ncbi:MAG: hypothetical protein ABIR59_07275 [Gemmatimonadales bacterium]
MSGGRSKGLGILLTAGIVAAAFTFLMVVLDQSRGFDNPMPLVVLAAGMVMLAGFVRSSIGRAIGRMLDDDRDALPDDQLVMRVEDIEARLHELSLEQSRVTELEGRLDFAERMLIKGANAEGVNESR